MWSKFDDQFYLNPKNAAMSRDEQDLYFAGIIYCNGQLTDGFIPQGMLSMLGAWAKLPIEASAQAVAGHLVEHCFWEITANGWQVHDFLDWNISRAEAIALKEARSESGKLGGKASQAKKQALAQANAQALAQAKPEQNSTQSPSPSPSFKEKETHAGEDEKFDQTQAMIESVIHVLPVGEAGIKAVTAISKMDAVVEDIQNAVDWITKTSGKPVTYYASLVNPVQVEVARRMQNGNVRSKKEPRQSKKVVVKLTNGQTMEMNT
jgi:hypothetical protein